MSASKLSLKYFLILATHTTLQTSLNLGGVTVFTMFSYQAWTAWKLKSDLAQYKDQYNKEFEEKSYMFRNIELANRGVAVGFFGFGAGLSFIYSWFIKPLSFTLRIKI